jgi:hypothetical protein
LASQSSGDELQIGAVGVGVAAEQHREFLGYAPTYRPDTDRPPDPTGLQDGSIVVVLERSGDQPLATIALRRAVQSLGRASA